MNTMQRNVDCDRDAVWVLVIHIPQSSGRWATLDYFLFSPLVFSFLVLFPRIVSLGG